MGKIFRFLAGFLVGAAVGFALGLLLAPEAGEEFRALVQERIDEAIEEGRRVALDTRIELEQQLEVAKRAGRQVEAT